LSVEGKIQLSKGQALHCRQAIGASRTWLAAAQLPGLGPQVALRSAIPNNRDPTKSPRQIDKPRSSRCPCLRCSCRQIHTCAMTTRRHQALKVLSHGQLALGLDSSTGRTGRPLSLSPPWLFAEPPALPELPAQLVPPVLLEPPALPELPAQLVRLVPPAAVVLVVLPVVVVLVVLPEHWRSPLQLHVLRPHAEWLRAKARAEGLPSAGRHHGWPPGQQHAPAMRANSSHLR